MHVYIKYQYGLIAEFLEISHMHLSLEISLNDERQTN